MFQVFHLFNSIIDSHIDIPLFSIFLVDEIQFIQFLEANFDYLVQKIYFG